MTGQLFNTNSPNQAEESSQGRSIADILALPPRQRQILNYIRRHKNCTLDDLVTGLNENKPSLESNLEDLINQSFLVTEVSEGQLYYVFELGIKKGSQVAIAKSAMVPGKPIGLIINPSGNVAIEAGNNFILRVSVINQGGQNAFIYVGFDESCDLVQQISGYIEPQSVALNPSQSHELVFTIPISKETLTGTYNYRLEVDAPNHYPETPPIFHTAQLQVRPYLAQAEQVSDPFFVLTPNTTSSKPFIAQTGEPIIVSIQVYNRSDQVDRFRLTCTDLPSDWYKITYPEGTPLPGLVINTDGLELNPNETNSIILTITPPVDALAKIYAPTLRVYSENQLKPTKTDQETQFSFELVMLDLFYFQVQASYQLGVEMITRRGTITNQKDVGEYEIKLANKGNTPRKIRLTIDANNTGKICNYQFTSEEVILNPNVQTSVRLDLTPQGKWKKQFYPNTLNFAVEIIDQEQIEIPNNRFEGLLIIEGRPWWHFFLLILGILGTIGALIFLIWWLLFRPKPLPQVVSFNPQSVIYKAVNNDVIRLNWQISQPKRIKTITLNGYYQDGSPIAQPVVFDFSKGIPEALKDKCTLQELLTCNSIITNARKSEEYTFELTIVTTGKKEEIITAKTNPIKIDAVPLPEILEFFSTQPVYQEAKAIALPKTGRNNPQKQTLEGEILLNWSVNFADQLQGLILSGKNKEGVAILPPKTLVFRQSQDPKTLEFKTEICERKGENKLDCNPEPCKVQTQFQNAVLFCNAVPTGVKNPGEYTFDLTPIPKQKLEKPLPAKLTDLIKILPLPIKIISFQLKQNGQVLPDLPKYPFYVNPKKIDPKKPPILMISWQVEGGNDVKVELTPTPGTVGKQGTIPYIVSTNPTSETITLTITNSLGQKISRSFVIETIVLPESEADKKETDKNKNKPGTNNTNNQPLPKPPGSVPTLENSPTIPPEVPTNGGNNGSPSESPAPSPSPSAPPRPPEAPGATAPIPRDRNAPPPAELPPQIN